MKKITIECKLPDDMQKVVNKLQEISITAKGL